MWTDGQKDMTKLIDCFFFFFCIFASAPKTRLKCVFQQDRILVGFVLVLINKEKHEVKQRDATVDAWYSTCFTNYALQHCMKVNDVLHSPAVVSTVSIG